MTYTSAALFIIGTELTRGVIADRHTQVISSQLTQLGYRVDRMVLVPDDGTIGDVLRDCIDNCDLVVMTGGLGPTSDDMTRTIVANLAKVPLVRDREAFDTLHARIGERIWGANEQQTMIPQGFELIPNPLGTAPGFKGFIPNGERQIACVAMPGPPREMNPMFFDQVIPWLAQLIGHDDFSRSEYSTFLIPESKLEELCKSISFNGMQWGTRFQDLKISLYLVDGSEADRTEMANRLRSLVGACLVVDGDVQPTTLLTTLLEERGETISTAESCTSGYIAKLLTDQPGSSAWFWGGVASYANEAKKQLLGVRSETLEQEGAVSEACVLEMAEGMRRTSGSDWSLSVSGIAGPDGGTPEKPVGTVWFGFASKTRESTAVKVHIASYGRDSVRRRASVMALILATQYIKGACLLDTVKKWQYI
ncbi:nicotinamide-nucleotide amidohydrolase family protein [Sphaerochaeta halotolerans]|jgi:nicotinamide-nucleotide amidase|uniref:CinA-like protein n=1 Tax=Sphaerochaeta halotolerans TaxID=2293840 RepID=A0A372MJP4_9SPIR|nr:nicotinamide-nucleotide amidohydrolase family protein [Sphaerochaeta halotolerans]MBG0766048.1 nicotinamide-nucleotide amidohydrolase family protein [Spirochaetaceae bacterium]MDK2859907.1 nicotinamide-nucleotide amidase [Sphaerochaeta sp.]MXI87106.1 nicotinamide-nucleotide amidohydrolase family protein [Sphaerochaeta halotolerans]RFU95536.1 nicotinamide-nucleotide amidohydrolase family protein [Sphaerochaeta halotolerans]